MHGCMYELRPVSQHDADQFIGKAWCIECSDKAFAEHLERRCDGQHRHVTIAGAETEASGLYPLDLAKRIHTGAQHFADSFRGIPRSTTSTRT